VKVQAELLYAVVQPVWWRSKIGVSHIRVSGLRHRRRDAITDVVASHRESWRTLQAKGYRVERFMVGGDVCGAVVEL
jgi:hypothetical protein